MDVTVSFEVDNRTEQPPPTIAELSIPPANFVNDLDITGRISAKARGKELVIAICNSKTRKNASDVIFLDSDLRLICV